MDILDTMGLNIAKDFKGYSEFFLNFFPYEKEISKLNQKFPNEINIKNEFYNSKFDKNITKGLFSINKIMCYCFVFDINSYESFHEVYILASILFNIENGKIENDNQKTIKIFIGNKFDQGINDEELKDKYYHSNEFIKRNCIESKNIQEIFNKLIILYKSENNVLDNLYFTSAKFNFNIENVFSSILKKINQKDKLWKNIDYDLDKKNNSDDENIIQKDKKSSFYQKVLCCFPQNRSSFIKNELKKDKKIKKLNGADNDSINDIDSNYDKNEKIVFNKIE